MFINGETSISRNKDFQKDRSVDIEGTLTYFPSLVDYCQKMIERDKSNYKTALSLYNEYVINVAYLCTDLIPRDCDIDYSIALSKLIHEGYLSLNNKFEFNTENFKPETMAAHGLNVVSGNACCRHVSAFHKDVFDMLSKYSKVLYGYESKIKAGHNKETANHAINVIHYNDMLIGHDAFNNKVYNFINESQLKSEKYKGVSPYYFSYKPYTEYLINNPSEEDIAYDLDNFYKSSIDKMINYSQFSSHEYYVDKHIDERFDIINDFCKENHKLKNEIVLSFYQKNRGR